MFRLGRRSFLRKGFLSVASAGAIGAARGAGSADLANSRLRSDGPAPPPFKLGLVTYNLARDWGIDTIIKNCEAAGFEALEPRTTHKHGIEISLDKTQRAEVKKRFADSRVRLFSLGTTCEFESPDPATVEKNIEETRRWCELAEDLGCTGVKVRPNGFPQGIPEQKTLDQIGQALAKCGEIARGHGVEIWLEVHGPGTMLPANIHHILSIANHPSVGACWNSNDTDTVNSSVKPSFDLLNPWIRSCHINELWRTAAPWQSGRGAGTASDPDALEGQKPYPWRELFQLFRSSGFNRYTYAEIPNSPEPLRLMHYYRALWEYLAA